MATVHLYKPDFAAFGTDWPLAWDLYRNTPYREDCAKWIAETQDMEGEVFWAALAASDGCEASARDLTLLAAEAVDVAENPGRNNGEPVWTPSLADRFRGWNESYAFRSVVGAGLGRAA